ncbi:VPLPA-CTERM sorting domain-containing protein [Thiohalobacter thiocyanaticus]|uniref:VPLPA-CTERM sorting domain-containing protein n=1 Tax=Thiohalobacter thiocyanaticus TaxID=585455 RepID=UPI0019D4B953|nr:VPLPA-CTERM sorting domain-containing protein [Thiohalobacter thiocyanaticus]
MNIRSVPARLFGVLLLMLGAGSANAALIGFTLEGTVASAAPANPFGLSVNDIITASGVYDDTTIDINGDIDFSTGTNNMEIQVGSYNFTDADDALGGGTMTLSGGSFVGLSYLAGTLPGFNSTVSTFASLDGTIGGSWDVNSFQTTVVPVPAAVWLFGSGLLGLVGIARRRH